MIRQQLNQEGNIRKVERKENENEKRKEGKGARLIDYNNINSSK